MTEEESHEYFLNSHELAPSIPKYAQNTTFDMDVGSKVILVRGDHSGRRGIITSKVIHRPSSSLYANHHVYRVVDADTKQHLGDFYEYQICRIDPSSYEVGEQAVVFTHYNPWKIDHWVPVWDGYYYKVEIVAVEYHPRLPDNRLYKVRRPGRKKEFSASGLNMRKIKTVKPFDPTDVDLSELLISQEILIE